MVWFIWLSHDHFDDLFFWSLLIKCTTWNLVKKVYLIQIINWINHSSFMFCAFSQSEHPLWLMQPLWSNQTFFKIMISCSEKQFFLFLQTFEFSKCPHYFFQIFVMIPNKYHNKKWMKCWFLRHGMPLAQTLSKLCPSWFCFT